MTWDSSPPEIQGSGWTMTQRQETMDADIRKELDALERKQQRRRLRAITGPHDAMVTLDGRAMILLSSNNYLGLAGHPRLIAAAKRGLDTHGCGTPSSRLISGTLELHDALERKLAGFMGSEAALIFSTGYMANLGVLQSLAGPGDTVFSDALNHASIIDGCRLSRAHVCVYPHRDLAGLEDRLRRTPGEGRKIIISEALFSMDGDEADLAGLADLSDRYDASLIVDEAHNLGTTGPDGSGAAAGLGIQGRVYLTMGTLGKAFGLSGAFVSGGRPAIDFLVNRARSFIFTTAPPPPTIAAAMEAISLIREEPERRAALSENAKIMRRGLTSLGFDCMGSRTHIIPVLVGDNDHAIRLSARLEALGVLAHAIRPPSVPSGTARIRVTPTAAHTPEMLDRALAAFETAGREIGLIG